ncbi:hypothetical protein AgCh_010395 [Apium graveolens]
MEGTKKCSANYVPLTPISFLKRAAIVYRDRVSIVYGEHVKFTWRQTLERCTRLASALTLLGVSPGDVVAAFAPNVPAVLELHFAVPMAGAVLSVLNTRYDSALLSELLKQSGAKVIFVDYEFLDIAKEALQILSKTVAQLPRVVLISESDKPSQTKTETRLPETSEYESLLETGSLDFEIRHPRDECDPISISYTSGTTATPKAVVYSHRGAYLNSLSAAFICEMSSMPVFLWSVPLFHCNGWCFTWAVAALGGTNICLRDITAKTIFDSIALHRVTHMGGAPTVLNMIANAPREVKKALPGKVMVMTGGAPPPPQVIFKMEELGFVVTHSYGQTETYGPGTVCFWKPEWNALPREEQANMKSRQGVLHIGMEEVDVKDPTTMKSVPPDGKTIGEIMYRGNTVMNGYFKNRQATEDAFRGGWFRSGDMGVKHEDDYIVLKDRSQDIIISGGENISTVEVEAVLFSHPAILEAAVVGRPDNHRGETSCAFVKLKDGSNATGNEIISYCQSRLPRYMAPCTVVFEDLPKTSTGKTQKFILRQKAKAMGSLSMSIASRL